MARIWQDLAGQQLKAKRIKSIQVNAHPLWFHFTAPHFDTERNVQNREFSLKCRTTNINKHKI